VFSCRLGWLKVPLPRRNACYHVWNCLGFAHAHNSLTLHREKRASRQNVFRVRPVQYWPIRPLGINDHELVINESFKFLHSLAIFLASYLFGSWWSGKTYQIVYCPIGKWNVLIKHCTIKSTFERWNVSTTSVDHHYCQILIFILLYKFQDAVNVELPGSTPSQGNSGDLMPPPSTSSARKRPSKVNLHMCLFRDFFSFLVVSSVV
jgi:hypothetical protein